MSAYQVQADPTAVMGRRIVAFIIDMVLVWGVIIGGFALFVESETVDFNPCADPVEDGFQVCSSFGVTAIWDGDQATLFDSDDANIAYGVGAVYGILVFWILQGLSGMTPGKAVLGVRTVNEQGAAPGIGRAILRSILMIVDGFCCYLVGLISAMSSKGHRRVGDMAAKTFVVGKGDMGRPPSIEGLTPPAAAYAASGPYAQAQPAAWPTTAPEAAPMAPTAGPPTAGAEPQWDEARQAYIQWDAAQNAWLQFDQGSQTWTRI